MQASERIRELLGCRVDDHPRRQRQPGIEAPRPVPPKSGSAMIVPAAMALGQDLPLSVAGQIETPAGREPVLGKFRVWSCKLPGIGKYDIELARKFVIPEQPVAPSEEDVDHYEVLQLSRNADIDTIRRVFHVLAQRYHPDNKETGDEEKFREGRGARGPIRPGAPPGSRCKTLGGEPDSFEDLRFRAEHP